MEGMSRFVQAGAAVPNPTHGQRRRLGATIRLLAIAVLLLSGAGAATAQDVDLELVLAADVSTSMDDLEIQVQRDGLASAFRDLDIIQAITSGPHGRIAVTYFEFSGAQAQQLIVPWMIVDDAESAHGLADLISTFAGGRLGEGKRLGTSISAALEFGETLLATSGLTSERQVIDLSADGENNIGPQVRPIRNRILDTGIVINGLPILLGADGEFGMFGGSNESTDLVNYFRESVIGGPGAFLVPTYGISSFYQAVRQKLITEIAGL